MLSGRQVRTLCVTCCFCGCAAAGTVVTYTFTVRNNGNTLLQSLNLEGPAGSVLTALACGANPLPVDLAIGAELGCSAQHEVTQPELEAGSIEFNITATSANGLEASIALATVTTTASASMSATVDTTGCVKPTKACKQLRGGKGSASLDWFCKGIICAGLLHFHTP